MKKQDITMYSSRELSLIVFNDEFLYNVRHMKHLKDLLDDSFIYTDEQYEELMEDLKEEE